MALSQTTLVAPGFGGTACAAIDVGGSLVKVAYLANKNQAIAAVEAALSDDVLSIKTRPKSTMIKPGAVGKLRLAYEKKADETKKEKLAGMGKLTFTVHLTTLDKSRSQEVLATILNENCNIPVNKSGQKVVTVTGVGALKQWEVLEKKIGIKLNMVDEFDCGVKGFKHLYHNLPSEEVFQPFPEDIITEVTQEEETFKAATRTTPAKTIPDDATPKQRFETIFEVSLDPPLDQEFLMASLGSGVGFIKANKDGTSQVVEALTTGGKSFMALGKLISGKQSFEEMALLAAKGETKNVNTVMSELQQTPPDGSINMYNAFCGDWTAYNFGKLAKSGAKKDDFKTEDLMAALLDMIALNTIATAYNVALANGVSTVFLSGSQVSSATFRKALMKHSLGRMARGGDKVRIFYCQYPSYVEAIGALLAPIGQEESNGVQTNGETTAKTEQRLDEQPESDSESVPSVQEYEFKQEVEN